MSKKRKYKPLEISGDELDSFINKLVDRLYNRIWSDIAIGSDEAVIKGRLRKSIIEALNEYAVYESDEKPG